MVVLGEGAVSYERGTPVSPLCGAGRGEACAREVHENYGQTSIANRSYRKRVSILELSSNEAYCTNAVLLLIKIMRSKLHYHNFFN